MCEQSYTASEAAKLLDFSAVRTRELLREGKLRGSKIPGTMKWRIALVEIARFKEHGPLSPEESDGPETAVLPAFLRDVVKLALDKPDALHPHQFIAQAMIDLNRVEQKALSLAFPGADGKAVYDSIIQRHAGKVDYETATFAVLVPYRKHLQESGLWSYVETWEECIHDYIDLLLDFSATVSRYVDDVFEGLWRDTEQRSEDRRGNDDRDRRAVKTPQYPGRKGDLRAAFTVCAVPNFVSAVLFSSLLVLAAKEQPTNPIWATELRALKDLRIRIVAITQALLPEPINWSNIDDLATKIWKDEVLFEKAVATADAYIKAERARVEMRENFFAGSF